MGEVQVHGPLCGPAMQWSMGHQTHQVETTVHPIPKYYLKFIYSAKLCYNILLDGEGAAAVAAAGVGSIGRAVALARAGAEVTLELKGPLVIGQKTVRQVQQFDSSLLQ